MHYLSIYSCHYEQSGSQFREAARKQYLFWKIERKKNPVAIKLEEGGKALMAWQLVEELFSGFPYFQDDKLFAVSKKK